MKRNSRVQDVAHDVNEGKEFKGYTLDELRYQRALLMIKKEFLKERAMHNVEAIKSHIPLVNGKNPIGHSSSSNGILGKIMKGLDFADYLVLGMQVVKIGKKIGRVFKRKKK